MCVGFVLAADIDILHQPARNQRSGSDGMDIKPRVETVSNAQVHLFALSFLPLGRVAGAALAGTNGGTTIARHSRLGVRFGLCRRGTCVTGNRCDGLHGPHGSHGLRSAGRDRAHGGRCGGGGRNLHSLGLLLRNRASRHQPGTIRFGKQFSFPQRSSQTLNAFFLRSAHVKGDLHERFVDGRPLGSSRLSSGGSFLYRARKFNPSQHPRFLRRAACSGRRFSPAP